MATNPEIADWLGVSERTVASYAAKGLIPKAKAADRDLKSCVRAIVAHFREMASGRQSTDGLDLAAERARLAKEQADAQALKNAESRRELLRREDVTAAVHDAFGRVRAKMLALPAKAAPAVATMTPTGAQQHLKALIHEALAELSEAEIVD